MKKDGLWPLKLVVYCMGVMLLGGFLWLGGRLALKADAMNSARCSEISLPATQQGAELEELQFEGGYWIARYGQVLAIRYDGCGKIVQRIVIKP